MTDEKGLDLALRSHRADGGRRRKVRGKKSGMDVMNEGMLCQLSCSATYSFYSSCICPCSQTGFVLSCPVQF